MLDFGYCLWLSPNSESELYKLCNNFTPHISLATDFKDIMIAKKKFEHIKKKNIQIKIIDIPIVTIDSGFNALQFNVELVNIKQLPLKPSIPHISFIYKYDQQITEDEIIKITQKIDFNKIYSFDNYKLMNCNGHYKNWYEMF